MENKFSFGKVKGELMEDVLNRNIIHSTFSGLQYLWGMKNKTAHAYIKEEIEACFKTYSKDYIIQFGKYKGLTLSDIDDANPSYIEKYLLKNESEEISGIVNYYMKFCRNQKRNVYDERQQLSYKCTAEKIKKINDSNRKHEIIRVLEDMGYSVKNKNSKYSPLQCCPFGCESKVGNYEHAYLTYGKDLSWLIYCCKCSQGRNFIKFVAENKNMNEIDAVNYISDIMGISINENLLFFKSSEVKDPEVDRKVQAELLTKRLPEMDISEFGFDKKVYPPYFYSRGFNKDDGEKAEVYYAGKDCKNGFKTRICFIVRDLENRIVGVVGRSQFGEEEYYDNNIRYFNIDKSLNREKQIEILKGMNKRYVKYFNKLESRYVLYNANALVNRELSEIFICEGPFDVMKMVCKHDYKNTVGMFGKDLKNGQLYQLYQLCKDKIDNVKIYMFVDNDDAGIKSFEKNVEKLQEIGFEKVYKMILNDGKDAAEATKESVDRAYTNAELQSIRYVKKKVICKEDEK